MFKIQLNTSNVKEVEAVQDFINGRLDATDFVEFDGYEIDIIGSRVFYKMQKFLISALISHTSIIKF